jgi:hypothetical protein
MNEPNDHRRLLSDILSEESDADFRESLLLHTVSLARRRRKQRQLRRAASVLLLLIAGLGLLLWRTVPPRLSPLQPQQLVSRPYVLIETHPLPSASLVKTEPLPVSSIITSVPTENIVSTMTTPKVYREIDDRELFALAPAPLILIRYGSNTAEVVFADPADQEKFLRN